jgi:hypothetical protein
MARTVQRPGEQGHVAVVLRGGKGVGKSFLAKHFGKLFGRHFLHISNPSHLVGNFNSHLRDTCVLFADEAFVAGDKKHDSILKTLVTEDMLAIEGKGIDVVQSPNFLHIIMATNDDHAVQASGDERRYLMLDVGGAKQQNSAYFASIVSDLESGGYQNLLHFLLSYDLTGFDVRAVPATNALRDQQEFTRENWLNAIVVMAEDGVTPDHDGWKRGDPSWVSTKGILEAVGEDAEDRSLQMKVKKALLPLLAEADGKPIVRYGDIDCLCEQGRAPVPVSPTEDLGYQQSKVHRVQRRFYRLQPLQAVRAKLQQLKLRGDWDERVSDWKPRGDKGWADVETPF